MTDRPARSVDRAAAPADPNGSPDGCNPDGHDACRAGWASTGLPELLAHQITAARESLGIEHVSILSLDRDCGALVLAASSLPPASLKDPPSKIALRFAASGPLSECAIFAEERRLTATEMTAQSDEAAILCPLGRSVLILPLIGRSALRCWRELDCSRKDCPAHGAPEPRCWLVSGTLCRDGRQREPQEKLDWCLSCPAFSVVGVMAVGVSDDSDASALAERAELRHITANVTATIEAAQSTKALLRLNAELERRVAEEVKEREIARQRVSASEKLAATGRLVAGLAHQLNNPLGAIYICVQSLKAGGSGAAATARNIEIIATEVRRLSRLVRSLLDFARDRELQITEVDLGELVGQSMYLAGAPARRSGVTLHVAEADGQRASVDRALIQQVLLNLVANAIQAVPHGGHVDVRVREGPAADDGGRTVDIIVRDNGPGMEPDLVSRAFDPFFTTKSASGGIGLGLSLAASIVKKHGGAILVDSSPGEGAAFTVRLPVCR